MQPSSSSKTPIERPAPAATGQLKKTPILHLLVYALERKLTGTLELKDPAGQTAAVLFMEGQPAKVRTSEPVAYLGRVLLELGYLTDTQLDKSLVQLSKMRRLHGQLLLEAGLIDEAKLREGLRQQLVRKVGHLFTLTPDTQYAYYDGFDALHDFGDDGPTLDPYPLVWNAIREWPPWEHVHAALQRVGSLPLRISSRANLARFGFSKKELELLELVRSRPMRIPEMASAEIIKPRDAQLLAYCLIITKQMQIVQEGVTTGTHRIEATPTAQRAPIQPHPATEEKVSFAMRVEAASVLPPIPPARPTPTPPGAGQPQSSSIRVAPVKPPPLETTPVPRMSPAAIAALPPELALRRGEILSRAETIDREDYFMMLDLDRDASVDKVREQYFALAKVWHPDRVPPQIGDVRDACARVFARISEAYQTLTDAQKRERYSALMKEGGATPEAQQKIANVVEAAQNFQKAEICVKRNDLGQADVLVKKAVAADPDQPDYIALSAWLDALKAEGQDPKATMAAISKLDRAIQISQKCERAHYYRGMLHKRLGNVNAAVRDFKQAAELNPRNIDAAREVRLHNMRASRGGSSPPPAAKRATSDRPNPPKPGNSGGLLGKLFKK